MKTNEKNKNHGEVELPAMSQLARVNYGPASRGGTFALLRDGTRIEDKDTVALIVRRLTPGWSGNAVGFRASDLR